MVWGILGIIVTIICTFIPFFWVQKDRTIRYWQVEAESIFSKKIKEIKNLTVLYENKEISDDVIILKTVIENNGRKDIDDSIVYEPLQIIFKNDFTLLDYELIEAPSGINLFPLENGIECKWKLFKKHESIVLKIMLKKNNETLKNSDLLKKYTDITYRITNVDKIKKSRYTNSLDEKPTKIFLFYLGIALFCCLIIGFAVSHDLYQIRYKSSLLPEQTSSVNIKDKNSIILNGSKETRIITIDEYNKTSNETEIVVIKGKLNICSITFIIFSMVLIFAPFIITFVQYLTDKKIQSFFIHKK